jgi:hypothetical protein
VGAPLPAPTPQALRLDHRRARRRCGDRQGHPQAPPPDDYTIALQVRAVERRVWIACGGIDRGRAGHIRGGVGLVDIGPSRCGDGGVEVLTGGEQRVIGKTEGGVGEDVGERGSDGGRGREPGVGRLVGDPVGDMVAAVLVEEVQFGLVRGATAS